MFLYKMLFRGIKVLVFYLLKSYLDKGTSSAVGSIFVLVGPMFSVTGRANHGLAGRGGFENSSL